MAGVGPLLKAVNLSPTTRVLPSGVPLAPRLSLTVRAPHSAHGHGHGAAPRTDNPPRWAGGVTRSLSAGLTSKTLLNGLHSFRTTPFLQLKFIYSSPPDHVSTALHAHFGARQGCTAGPGLYAVRSSIGGH